MSTFTPNKNLEMPANGSYNNDWNVPVNATTGTIDTAFGGVTYISVTGVTNPYNSVSLAQYTPPDIEFVGTIGANLYYIVPSGVGGLWTVYNATSGAFSLYFNTAGGSSVQIPQGYRVLCVSDGVNMEVADNGTAYLAQLAAQATAQGYANTAQSNAEGYTQAFASNASNISSGTVANAHLNNVGIGPGVTIAANPGTTPSGPPGSVWFYY